MKFFLIAFWIFIAKSLSEDLQCPPGCFCDKRKAGSLPSVTGHQDGLRVQCFQLEGERLDPGTGKLPHNTVEKLPGNNFKKGAELEMKKVIEMADQMKIDRNELVESFRI